MGNYKNRTYADPYRWHGTTVCYILERVEYIGHMVNFKTYKANFKDKHRHKNPADKLVIYEDAHEAIIDPETWETANRIRQNAKRRRLNDHGEANPLTGMLWCYDCGGKLYNERGFVREGEWKDIYICSTHRKRTKNCTTHRIRTDTVKELILDTLRTVSEYACNNEAEFARQVNEMFSNQQAGVIKAQRKKLTASQKRRDELDKLIQRIYEDMVAGRITDKRFEVLSGGYEREQAELEQAIAEIQTAVDSFDDSAARAESFLELTASMLHEFVQKIVVHERAEKKRVFTTQKVEIHLNFIGQYAPPILPDEEEQDPVQTERERKREYHREYQRRRKENGGKPLILGDTRTLEQVAADDAEKKEKQKAYNREYQREWHRKKAREKRESKAVESNVAAS
jgi:hypothetical protein